MEDKAGVLIVGKSVLPACSFTEHIFSHRKASNLLPEFLKNQPREDWEKA